MSAPNRKPRGVHPYTDGRGRRCFRIEYVGSDGGRHFKRLGPVTQKQAVQERENLNVAIRRRELVVDGKRADVRRNQGTVGSRPDDPQAHR